jgi:hypothetical protein
MAKQGKKKSVKFKASAKRKAWERQPNETDKAFEAFKVYIDLGTKRSIAKAGQVLGKCPEVLQRWSTGNHWRARVDAWEAEQDADWSQDRKRRIREASERHANLARSATDIIAAALSTADPGALSPGDVARWLDVAVKVERLSLGMSTNVLAGTGEGGEIEHKYTVAIREAEQSISRRLGLELAGEDAPGVVPEPND